MSNVSMDDFCAKRHASATWALWWKQWRELLQPMAVLTLGSLVLMTTFGFVAFKDGYYGVMASVPITMSMCFIFVCCFISFVSESENETSSFLMNLPLSSVHVGIVKVVVIVAAIVSFCFGQALMAAIGAWIKLRTEVFPESQVEEIVEGLNKAGLSISVFVSLAFVISLVSCSFWSRSWSSVLTAALLACYAIFAFAKLDSYIYDFKDSPLLVWEAWLLAVSLAVLVVGAIWFPLRWLRKRPSRFARSASAAIDGAQSAFVGSDEAASQSHKKSWKLFEVPRGGRFGALLWQSVGQQRIVLMFCSFFLIILVTCVLGAMVNRSGSFFVGVMPSLIPAFGLTGLGAGWLTLQHDKKNNNFEFFQQHREHGITFMIARIIPPIAVLLLLAGIALACSEEMAWRSRFRVSAAELENLEKVALFSCAAFFSVVVLCSMIFRSQVYALGVAILVAIGWLASISRVMSFHPEFYWMLGLPLVWLLSSVAYGPRWLSGRRSWAWTVYFTIVLLSAFTPLIYAFVCWCLGIEIEA